MSRTAFKCYAVLLSLLITALLTACGSSNREGSGNPESVARVSETGCRICHAVSTDPLTGGDIVDDFLASPHNREDVGCQGCHGGGAQHNGIGPIPFPNPVDRCAVCHDGTGTFGSPATTAAHVSTFFPSVGGVDRCGSCHNAHNPLGRFVGGSCVACHAFPLNRTAFGNFVNDNNGVRAITGEFAKRSHHVTGRAATDADCAVCHLEGKRQGTAVVIDTAFHMKDDRIYLRNGNTGLGQTPNRSVAGGYPWQPSNPDHTLMDQFCFSCHNEAGAPDAVAALTGVAGYTGTALNPFGDSVANDYDQVSRINVVGVYEQFDTGNSSHHAVRGQKYTSNFLNASHFTNISTANANNRVGGVPTPIVGVKGAVSASNPAQLTGTMFQTGKFVATYTTLNGAQVADNSTLHCGDCHTVGQYRQQDVNVTAGFNRAVIGAHGSNNEYMLRNSNGDDTFARDALVCFICHVERVYSNPGQTEIFQEDGIVAHNSVNNSFADCNGNNQNSAGLVGTARLVPDERTMDDATFQAQVAAGIYTNTGGGNIFGIKCANCHNASDKKTFGGIHGNAGNANYLSYSGAKNPNGVVTTVNRKPYRFMGGLGNIRYNGGDSADQWTVKTLAQANKQGCYTLNGASTVTRPVLNGVVVPANTVGAVLTRVANPSPTRAVASGANVSNLAIADDNGILGSWGSCTDHAGTSVFGGRAVTRNLLRPLTY